KDRNNRYQTAQDLNDALKVPAISHSTAIANVSIVQANRARQADAAKPTPQLLLPWLGGACVALLVIGLAALTAAPLGKRNGPLGALLAGRVPQSAAVDLLDRQMSLKKSLLGIGPARQAAASMLKSEAVKSWPASDRFALACRYYRMLAGSA